MSKHDQLMRDGAANAFESIGVGVTRGPGNPPMTTSSAPARWQGVVKSKNAVEVPVSKIRRDPHQPREEFDEDALGRLAESLRTKGQLQPIRVRWDEGQGAYLVVCGERRWRAAGMAGLTTVSAVVMEGDVSANELLALQLVENALREDLRPIEQARGYRALIDANGWTVRQLAAELAISHAGVVRALALLDLPPSVQADVEVGKLNPTTAYEIAKADDPAVREELGRRAVTERLTSAEVKAAREHVARPKHRKLEWKAPGGAVVTVSLPGDLGDSAALAALQHACREAKKSRTSGPSEAA